MAAERRRYEAYQNHCDRFRSCDSPCGLSHRIYPGYHSGTGFLIGAVLTGWLGVRRQKGAQEEYASDVRRYTARTMMKLVHLEESVMER